MGSEAKVRVEMPSEESGHEQPSETLRSKINETIDDIHQ